MQWMAYWRYWKWCPLMADGTPAWLSVFLEMHQEMSQFTVRFSLYSGIFTPQWLKCRHYFLGIFLSSRLTPQPSPDPHITWQSPQVQPLCSLHSNPSPSMEEHRSQVLFCSARKMEWRNGKRPLWHLKVKWVLLLRCCGYNSCFSF